MSHFVMEVAQLQQELADAQKNFGRSGTNLSSLKEVENGITFTATEVSKVMKYMKTA